MSYLQKYFVPSVGLPVGILSTVIWLFMPAQVSTTSTSQQGDPVVVAEPIQSPSQDVTQEQIT